MVILNGPSLVKAGSVEEMDINISSVPSKISSARVIMRN